MDVFKANVDENKKVLGLIIKINRMKQNMSQRALAETASINAGYLCTIERCEKVPHDDIINSIFAALDLKYMNDPEFIRNSLYKFNEIYNNIIFMYDVEGTSKVIKELEEQSVLYINSSIIVEYYLTLFVYYVVYGIETKTIELLDILESINDLLSENYAAIFNEYKGVYLSDRGSFKQAEDFLQKALKLSNTNIISAMVKYHLGNLYSRSNDNVESIIFSQEARQEFESYGNYKRALYCQLSIGKSYGRITKIDKARYEFLNVMNASKKLGFQDIVNHAIKNLMWTYLKHGMYEEVYKIYKDVYSDSFLFEDPFFIYYICFMFNKLDKTDELVFYLKKGAELSKDDKVMSNLFKSISMAHQNNDEYEQLVYEILADAELLSLKELYEFFGEQLIGILVSKRKYKEAFELQSKLYGRIRA